MTDDPGTPQVHGSDVADDFLRHWLQYRAAGIRLRRCPCKALHLHQMITITRHCGDGALPDGGGRAKSGNRSEEHTSELQSLMRISYAVFCLKKKKKHIIY